MRRLSGIHVAAFYDCVCGTSLVVVFGGFGISIDFVHQRPRRCRYSNLASQYFMAIDVLAIHGFVSTLVGLHYRTIQAHSGKNAFRP